MLHTTERLVVNACYHLLLLLHKAKADCVIHSHRMHTEVTKKVL